MSQKFERNALSLVTLGTVCASAYVASVATPVTGGFAEGAALAPESAIFLSQSPVYSVASSNMATLLASSKTAASSKTVAVVATKATFLAKSSAALAGLGTAAKIGVVVAVGGTAIVVAGVVAIGLVYGGRKVVKMLLK